MYGIVFQTFFPERNPKIIVYISRKTKTHENEKKYVYKVTLVRPRRLLQYFQSPDKCPCDISSYIYNFSRYFKIVMCYSGILPQLQTVFCGTLCFRGTHFEKHWYMALKFCRCCSPCLSCDIFVQSKIIKHVSRSTQLHLCVYFSFLTSKRTLVHRNIGVRNK